MVERLATLVRRFRMLPTTVMGLGAFLWGSWTERALQKSAWYWIAAAVAFLLYLWAAHRVDVWIGKLRWESRSVGYDDGYDEGFRHGTNTVLHMVDAMEGSDGR